ncbi:MAG: ester cyclase [bacterium]
MADLHCALDGTESAGGALVHGDPHPGNVVMSEKGPVLIDWTNHRTGPRALDVALTWLLLDCFDPDEPALTLQLAPLRAELLRSFSAAVDVVAAAAALPDAAAIRHADPATTPERAAEARAWIAPFRVAFPDVHMNAVELLAERDVVIGGFTCTATHRGEWLGHLPTGRRFTAVDEVNRYRLQDGRIADS